VPATKLRLAPDPATVSGQDYGVATTCVVTTIAPPATPLKRTLRLRVLLLAAPLIFIAHVLEEAPGFVAWFNVHVDRGITQEMFWGVNNTGLVVTLVVVALEWLTETPVSALAAMAWLSCLMAANALFHVVAAIVDGAYVPGLITAVVLYLPYYAWFVARLVRARRVQTTALVVAGLIGAAPMLVHCYLIVFERSRLF
jgi:hypothetical protein